MKVVHILYRMAKDLKHLPRHFMLVEDWTSQQQRQTPPLFLRRTLSLPWLAPNGLVGRSSFRKTYQLQVADSHPEKHGRRLADHFVYEPVRPLPPSPP